MAAPYERPDLRALEELETLLRHLTDELAGWRRRTLKAEAEVQELRAKAGGHDPAAEARVAELERENAALRRRVEGARERVKLLADRLSFLEQTGDRT